MYTVTAGAQNNVFPPPSISFPYLELTFPPFPLTIYKILGFSSNWPKPGRGVGVITLETLRGVIALPTPNTISTPMIWVGIGFCFIFKIFSQCFLFFLIVPVSWFISPMFSSYSFPFENVNSRALWIVRLLVIICAGQATRRSTSAWWTWTTTRQCSTRRSTALGSRSPPSQTLRLPDSR